jgi:predicted DNA-binding transcriptional regulator AlpA
MTELNLTTFRHILQHSLMPWLAENQDIQKFKMLTRRLPYTEAEGNYFSHLQLAFKQTGIQIPVSLTTEWNDLSALPSAANSEPIREIFGTPVSHDKRFEFYLRLITEATCAYWVRINSYTSENQSADLRKSLVSTVLKSCHDLMEQTALLSAQKEEYRDILTLLLTGLKVIFLETGILHRGFYETHLIYLNDEEICSFGNQEMVEGEHGGDKNKLGIRFTAYYNNRMTDRMTVRKGQESKDTNRVAIEPALRQMETEAKDENWRKFEALYKGNADTAVENPEKPMEKEAQPATEIAAASDEEPFISRNEVMKLLGIGKTTLWKKSRNGEIPCYNFSGRYKYRRSEIIKFQQSLQKSTVKRN